MRARADSEQPTDGNKPHGQSNVHGTLTGPAHCPLLGMVDDPATSFAYATPGNQCFRERSPDAIELHHQESFCLTRQHTACPLFQEATNGSQASSEAEKKVQAPLRLPGTPLSIAVLRDMLGARVTGLDTRLGLVLAGTGFALLLVALLYFAPGSLSAFGGDSNGITENPSTAAPDAERPLIVIDDTSTASPTPTTPPPTATARQELQSTATETTSLVSEAAQTSSPTPRPSPTASPTPTATLQAPETTPTARATSCGPPSGWSASYVVRPGENLYRISLRYNTSVATMMQANCLSSTSIYAGQSLIVPFQVPVNTVTPVPPDPESATETPAAPQPTTPPQPTSPPPPTNTPPPPTATPPSPPTSTPPPPPTPTPPLPAATEEGG